MNELMKRYEAETDEMATWRWHDKEFVTDDYIAWLEAQLTWRPTIEKPEKACTVALKRIDNGIDIPEQTWFYFLESLEDFDIIVDTLEPTHWLPIPPALGA